MVLGRLLTWTLVFILCAINNFIRVFLDLVFIKIISYGILLLNQQQIFVSSRHDYVAFKFIDGKFSKS